MNRSNVFYLPRPPEPEVVLPPTRWSILRARLARRWLRMQIVMLEIRAILARPGRRTLDRDYPGFLEAAAAAAARPRRPVTPARVLDFEAARLRRRRNSPS